MSRKKVYTRQCFYCKEEVSYRRGNRPDYCPFCNYKYWEKPGLEYELFLAQDEFIKDVSNPVAMDTIYRLLIKYIPPILTNILKRRNLFFDKEKFRMAVEDIASYFLEYYIKKFNEGKPFKVKASFYGYLYRFIPHVLFRRYKKNTGKYTVVSIEETPGEEGVNNIIDTLVKRNAYSLFNPDSEFDIEREYSKDFNNFLYGFNKLFRKYYKLIVENGGKDYGLLFLQSFYIKIKKGKKALENYFLNYDYKLKKCYLNFESDFYSYLKDFYERY